MDKVKPVEKPKLVKKKKKTNFDKARELNMISRVPLTDGLFANEINKKSNPILDNDEMVITEADLTNPNINFNKALKFINDEKSGKPISTDIDYGEQLKLTEDEKFVRALNLSNIKSEKEYNYFKSDIKIYLRALELLSQSLKDDKDLNRISIDSLLFKLKELDSKLPSTITNKTPEEIKKIKVDFTSDEEKILELLNETDIDLDRIKILVRSGTDNLSTIIDMIDSVQEFNNITPNTFEQFTEIINKGWNKLYKKYPTESVRLAQYADNEQGKGEKFIEFLFSNATTNGSSSSHDIDIHTNNGNYQFEVKCYTSKDSVIRLGTEGSMNNFKGIRILSDIYNNISEFLNLQDKEKEIFKAMISNALAIKINEKTGNKYRVKEGMTIAEAFDGLREFFISSYKGNKDKDMNEQKSYADRLNAGELNKTDFENIDNVINVFDQVCNTIIDNNYNYVKILKTNKVYVIVSDDKTGDIITSSREGDKGFINIKCYEETKDEWEKQNMKVKKTVLKMRDSISEGKEFTFNTELDINKDDLNDDSRINFIETLIGKSSEELSEVIKMYPIILINSKLTDMFKVSDTGNFCLGIFDRVRVNTINQNKFKITLVDSTSDKEFETNIIK